MAAPPEGQVGAGGSGGVLGGWCGVVWSSVGLMGLVRGEDQGGLGCPGSGVTSGDCVTSHACAGSAGGGCGSLGEPKCHCGLVNV